MINPRKEQLHLVTVEYTDADGVREDTIIWEYEHDVRIIEPTALPEIVKDPPMDTEEFDSLEVKKGLCIDTIGERKEMLRSNGKWKQGDQGWS